jgi:hypothetical protein
MPKTAEIEGYSKVGGGPGWKRCPSCEGYVKGPAAKECPACGHTFAFKSRIIAKPVDDRGSELEEHVMLLALKMGGLDAVRKAFEKLKTDPLIRFTISCGGVENTIRIVGAIDAKVKSVNAG